MAAGHQRAHAIGKRRDPGSGPSGDQPVHEGGGECVAGPDSICYSHGVALGFDIFAVGQDGTALCAEGDTYRLPAVTVGGFAAERFCGRGSPVISCTRCSSSSLSLTTFAFRSSRVTSGAD